MSTEQQSSDSELESQADVEPETDEHHNVLEEQEPGEPTEKPEITDEHKEKAKEMYDRSMEERETIKLPGSAGTVAGTAVNDWVDDDGNPKFGDTSESKDDS